MKNDLYIPLLSTPLRVRTRIPVWRDREKALSTIGSWSSSRDGLMLDRSLSLSLALARWRAVVPKKGIP